MSRTYHKGNVFAVQQDAPVDPLRAAGSSHSAEGVYRPNPDQVARGILQSPVVMDALLRQMAWYEPEAMDLLMCAWQEAKDGNRERLERYRTTPVSEW